MNTTNNNETQEVKKDPRKNANARAAATAGAAAMAGAAAGFVVNDIANGEEEPVTQTAGTPHAAAAQPAAEETQQQEAVTAQTTASQTHAEGQQSAAEDEPQPITDADTDVAQTVEPEPVVPGTEADDNTIMEPEAYASAGADDPNAVAQEIIHGDYVDPHDIDAEDVVNFTDVGTIHGADGTEYAAAVVHDTAGNEVVMVDVDGDNEFDVVTDPTGSVVAQVPDGGLNMSDAEAGMTDSTQYLAQTETDNTAVTDGMMDDMITT